ncbi:MAG: hypothetical protein PSN34_12000 [Urechidicola sp.]|nr:hypothetical protein [Urechidicola sp.]
MKMKYLFIISIILFSCQNNKGKTNQNEFENSIAENDNKQFFSDYFFKIESPCELQKDFSNVQENYYTYRCNSENNETVYSFSIKDLKKELSEFKTDIEKDMFSSEFLNSYKKELNANNIQYTEPYIYGFKALEYTIPTGSIFNKQAIFTSNGFAYTFNITANKNEINSLFSNYINSFELYHKSPKYSYSIEIPKGYSQQEIVGKNVDLKYVNDKGYSIILVVKKLPQDAKGSIDDMFTVSNDSWIKMSPFSEMKIIKKGSLFVDNTKGFFISYTAKEVIDKEPLYYNNYMFIKNGVIYTLTTTCKQEDIYDMRSVFFRVSNSLKFSN